MSTNSDETLFTRLQAQYAQLQDREQAYRSDVLWAKYRQFRPSSSSLTRTERAKLEGFRRQEDRLLDRMCSLLDRIGGRNFRSGAPAHWLMTDLSFADAVTTGAMSVVPPSPYGYSDRETAVFAGRVGPVCKVCGAVATLPVYGPDMCQACSDAAWARIDARAKLEPARPANTISNVWD